MVDAMVFGKNCMGLNYNQMSRQTLRVARGIRLPREYIGYLLPGGSKRGRWTPRLEGLAPEVRTETGLIPKRMWFVGCVFFNKRSGKRREESLLCDPGSELRLRASEIKKARNKWDGRKNNKT